jgi:hypothetical protein
MQLITRTYPGLFLVCALFLMGCSQLPFRRGTTVTTPVPLGDSLNFTTVYRANLEPGMAIPGTHLYYVGPHDGGFAVMINGQPTVKQKGDSFNWDGVIAPGVFADYNLRIVTALLGQPFAAGTVNLSILFPFPVDLPTLDTTAFPLSFSGILVQHQVVVMGAVPGTTLTYLGGSEQGAEFTVSGYRYRADGDSLVWTGQLRENVIARYNLRVGVINPTSVRVGGTVDLWIAPRTYGSSR